MNISSGHRLTAIAAMGENREIGKNNGLCFKSDEDMALFKSATEGNIVVMGRKTFESIRNGKGLPNRVNVVMTRDETLLGKCHEVKDGVSIVYFDDVDAVMDFVDHQKESNGKHSFLIGGEEIYALFSDRIDSALISRFDRTDEEADAFLPKIEDPLKLHESRVFNDFILDYYVAWA